MVRPFCTIGLIADTHYQDRLFSLPPGLEKWWEDADLILHAGDVGDLSVLDELGKIVPTVAVHGNDEPEGTKHDLPEQQLVTLSRSRILVWHSHYPDPLEEKRNRPGPWRPKLARIARRAQDVNAQVVVYGHTHVPIVHHQQGVVIVNPGALAAGSYFTRQVIRTVAKLQVHADGNFSISHYNVDAGQEVTLAEVNQDEEFDRLGGQYQDWIVEPGMIDAISLLRKMAYEDVRAVVEAIVPLYKQSLPDGPMRRDDFIRAIEASQQITPNDKENVLRAMSKMSYPGAA